MNWKEKCKKGVVTETGVLLRNLHAETQQKNKRLPPQQPHTRMRCKSRSSGAFSRNATQSSTILM